MSETKTEQAWSPRNDSLTTGQVIQLVQSLIRTTTNYPNGDPDFFKSPVLKARDSQIIANPYSASVWVYAACTAIATNLIQLPKALDIIGTAEKELVDNHPVIALLENPNSLMTGPTFWEAIILNLLLPTNKTNGGQCFLIPDSGTGKPVSLSRGDIPAEIFPFSDALIEPILDNQNHLSGWALCIPGKEKLPYTLDQIIRINLYDPANPLKGLSPLIAAYRALTQDMKAVALNENFFDNNASLGGTLQTDAEIESTQGKEILANFESKYQGSSNSGKIALLHSGIKYEQFQRTHVDMQFLDQRKFSRDEILAVYRVPKAEVSLYEDINYATALSANKSFWEKTLLPHDKRILWGINNSWIKYLDNGRYRLISDLSNVEALQENFKEKLEQAKMLFEMHVPLEEINRRLELNLMLSAYPWTKEALVPFSLSTATEVISPAPEPEEEEDTTTIPEGKSVVTKSKKNDRVRIQDYTKNVLDPAEKQMSKVVRKFFNEQRNKILDKVDAWANSHTKSIIKISTDEVNPAFFKLSPSTENLRLRKVMLPEYQRQVENEAAEMAKEIGPFINWNADRPEMQKALKQRLIDIKTINTTTFKKANKQIADAITTAINENLTVPQTARLLKKKINEVMEQAKRVNVIARTEIGIIHSTTRNDIMSAEGFNKRKWLTSQDELVRSAASDPPAEFPHDILDGEIVDLSKEDGWFNGETLRFPQDPSASAGNIINCRCVMFPER